MTKSRGSPKPQNPVPEEPKIWFPRIPNHGSEVPKIWFPGVPTWRSRGPPNHAPPGTYDGSKLSPKSMGERRFRVYLWTNYTKIMHNKKPGANFRKAFEKRKIGCGWNHWNCFAPHYHSSESNKIWKSKCSKFEKIPFFEFPHPGFRFPRSWRYLLVEKVRNHKVFFQKRENFTT